MDITGRKKAKYFLLCAHGIHIQYGAVIMNTTALTEAEYKSESEVTKYTRYLVLTG